MSKITWFQEVWRCTEESKEKWEKGEGTSFPAGWRQKESRKNASTCGSASGKNTKYNIQFSIDNFLTFIFEFYI